MAKPIQDHIIRNHEFWLQNTRAENMIKNNIMFMSK